jgi:hypothetical protein
MEAHCTELRIETQRTAAEVDSPVRLSVAEERNFNSSSCPPKILLLGDSVDRQVVEELCNRTGNQTIRDWSNKMFGYKQSAAGAALCETTEGSIGHLHVFGSNASGPYLHNISNTLNDLFVDTSARLCKGIEVFSHNVGLPTLIVFQIMLWDIYIFHRIQNITEAVKAQTYRNNIIARVKEIQSCKNSSSLLVLRTVPAMQWGRRLVVMFNEELKSISKEMGIGILDYDAMLWGMDRQNSRERALFRDVMHPRKEFSAKFASHLLDIGGDICKGKVKLPAL